MNPGAADLLGTEDCLRLFGVVRLSGGAGRFFLGWFGSSLDQTADTGEDEKADQGGVFQVFEPGEQKTAPDE
jgi:hypothetical protein